MLLGECAMSSKSHVLPPFCLPPDVIREVFFDVPALKSHSVVVVWGTPLKGLSGFECLLRSQF